MRNYWFFICIIAMLATCGCGAAVTDTGKAATDDAADPNSDAQLADGTSVGDYVVVAGDAAAGADAAASGDSVVAVDVPPASDINEKCPSGKHWMGGNQESPMMKPGQPCVSCHKENFGPALVFAGTVYPNQSAENDCNGTPAITVEITGADGAILTQTTNAAGNFFLKGAASKLKMPYTARVFDVDHMRPMLSPQTNGDCNSCHTQTGANGAPGRIMAP